MFRFDVTLCYFVGIFLAPSRAPSPITFGILEYCYIVTIMDATSSALYATLASPEATVRQSPNTTFLFLLLSPSAKTGAFLAVG